jgi:cytochrome c6
MRTSRLLFLILGLAVALFALLPNLAWAADDGASLYKAKCAVCHAADATGKPAVKAPSLISAEAKKMSDADLTDAIANGGKNKKPTHMFSKKGLSPDQIKSLVAYLRTLQK